MKMKRECVKRSRQAVLSLTKVRITVMVPLHTMVVENLDVFSLNNFFFFPQSPNFI